MDWLEVLKIIGFCLLCFAGLIGLLVLGYIQATWDMTPEEKDRLNKDIAENGLFFRGDDPWDF